MFESADSAALAAAAGFAAAGRASPSAGRSTVKVSDSDLIETICRGAGAGLGGTTAGKPLVAGGAEAMGGRASPRKPGENAYSIAASNAIASTAPPIQVRVEARGLRSASKMLREVIELTSASAEFPVAPGRMPALEGTAVVCAAPRE